MKMLFGFEKSALRFNHPHHIIAAHHPETLAASCTAIEIALSRGYYVAGFLAYEAGYAFDDVGATPLPSSFPLLYFGCYAPPEQSKRYIPVASPGTYSIEHLRLNCSREKYTRDIGVIREYIASGDVYQITYCIKLKFSFEGDPLSLYAALLREQPVPYPVFVETPHYTIMSLSPELFIKKNGARLVTKPMKGTWPRGNNIWSDRGARMMFQKDEKNRAENLMICDLLRNDLSKVGHHVHVPKLFEVTPYKTLFQMTSTVAGTVAEDTAVYDIFAALFPSGSVTGAPKIRAMQIIREVEHEPRHIYTGAIGYITPQRKFFFNIPIRTLLVENGKGEMGIGGGIVWDSTAEGEWAEGLLKARFFTDLVPQSASWV